MSNQTDQKEENKTLLTDTDNEIRDLVIARLSILSPDTLVSIGSEGDFTRDQLIRSVEQGDNIGEKFTEIQLAWLRSLKEVGSDSARASV
ncbi:MAG: hypothetical protein UV57_C0017G0008 [Parcubacteria group bacterium GW2011_GWD2_43_10]|uniref:Uncharacterized protein n=2 Tax=Candidatus Vebleniibacteriota TaxID=1817921 RepID=A0A1G2Q1Z2_9BACT|nr:MAG: hypothetical protein UV57_C0017G0008 [Parcubacteria group bacterium GW2011_GWD2_43_10]OHA54596.1 MAG: hypothetical protein A2226_00305 [Candidatus Veblenbacteria bacterium RIFOXYA2_FULL_43_9]OHA57503.1 MAG: hypothetical protein A2441_03820 [Candidatus Veblenbacteria bacterium RIFOXYC2_FULL_42_11]HAO81124.1 hypothetical protein [Candidatus Veblenbacteria bacterium]HBT92070.1 hypothetical protein [Candidatus Veblenbacteria bacterium]